MQSLSARQQSILRLVVDTHIDTAQPVGSKSVTDWYKDRYRASFSPATVRNEMGQLEEMGYLTHPHTSSGRIPTDAGYRYYVDHCVQQEPEGGVLKDLAQEMQSLQKIDFLIEKISKKLSAHLQEITLVILPDERLSVQGAKHILTKPEFQQMPKARALFEILDEKENLIAWLSNASSGSISVKIGQENRPSALHECALIAMSYGEARGTLAVLGPKRMKYSRALPLVQQAAQIIGRIVESRNFN